MSNLRKVLTWGRCDARLHGDHGWDKRCQLFDGHLFWHSWRSYLPWRKQEWQWAGEETPVRAVFNNRQRRVG